MTLADYIAANLSKPFEWGRLDCVLFARDWVRHATGIDHLAGYPAWHNEKEARRLMRKLGGLEALLDKHFDRIIPHLAPDGAIALHDGCLCLFSGAHIVGPGPEGLTFIDRTRAACAWHY
jgi:hypothetical protein